MGGSVWMPGGGGGWETRPHCISLKLQNCQLGSHCQLSAVRQVGVDAYALLAVIEGSIATSPAWSPAWRARPTSPRWTRCSLRWAKSGVGKASLNLLRNFQLFGQSGRRLDGGSVWARGKGFIVTELSVRGQ